VAVHVLRRHDDGIVSEPIPDSVARN